MKWHHFFFMAVVLFMALALAGIVIITVLDSGESFAAALGLAG